MALSGAGGAQLHRKIAQRSNAAALGALAPGLQIGRQLLTRSRGAQPQLAQLFAHRDHLVEHRVISANLGDLRLGLGGHPLVTRVLYPGLLSHPGRGLMQRQARGFGAMISFEVGSPELVERFLGRLKLISFAESLGGVESLATYPWLQTHADIEPELRARLGISETLLRLSVGIEDVRDLIADLGQALGGAEAR